MKKFFSFAIAVIITGAVLSPSAIAQTYKLRYTPKKGAAYNYKSAMDMQQSMNAMGQEISFNMLMNMGTELKVLNTTKKINELSMTFNDTEFTLNGVGAIGGQDTTMKVEALNGMTFKYTADHLGKIKSLDKSGLEKSQDQALKQMSNNITQLTNTLSFEYPEKALKKGDTWIVIKKDTNINDGGSIITTTNTTYEFDGVTDTLGVKCARIQTKSATMTMEGKIKQMGMDMAMEAEGNTKGTSYVELANGIPVATNTATQLDMRMAITGQENAIIPMQMDMKLAITRTK
jgi:hypothetical protein